MSEAEDTTIVDSLTLPTGPEVVKEDYVPEGFKTVEDYLTDMRETYALDVEHDDHNRREALDDKSFAAGNQWDPVVLEQRKGLPNLVSTRSLSSRHRLSATGGLTETR